MKPLILGEAPGRGKDVVGGMFPLSGAVGVRLCQLAGLEDAALENRPGTSRYGHYYWTLRDQYDLTNLLDYWPGQNVHKFGAYARGAAFPVNEAIAAKRERVAEFDGRTIILLGHRLMRVFRIHPRPFYEWHGWRSSCVAGIPHPSGLTRNYNDPAERERAGKILREAIERTQT